MFKNTAQFFLYANRSQMLSSPPLIYSVSSKHVFIAVSDFGAQKKKETWHFQFNFCHHTQAKFKSPSLGRTHKSNSSIKSPGTENKHVTCGQNLPGGRGVEVDWYITVIWNRNFPHFSPLCDNFAFTSL